jgi:large repetitive protein
MRGGQMRGGRAFRWSLKGLLASVVVVPGVTIGLSTLAAATPTKPTHLSTVTLSISPSSVVYGSTTPVTVSGTVFSKTAPAQAGNPTGTVWIFLTGKTTPLFAAGKSCTAPMTLVATTTPTKAKFSCTLTGSSVKSLKDGTYTFYAVYSGGPSTTTGYVDLPNYTTMKTFRDGVPTTTTLTIAPTSVAFDTSTPVTLTGTVSEPTPKGTGYPTGKVSITMTGGPAGASCTLTPTLAPTTTHKAKFSCTLTGSTVKGLAAGVRKFQAKYLSGAPSTGSFSLLLTSTSTVRTLNVSSTSPQLVRTAQLPGAPSLTSATGGTGKVHLIWIAPKTPGATPVSAYLVCYGTTSGALTGCTTSTTVGTTRSATVTGLKNGTKYYFLVKAKNGKGYGLPSNTLSVTPLPPPAPAVTRVAGATADTTAAAEFQRTFPATKGSCPASRAAIVASTAEYNDALASQFLAQSLTTGTLLTPTKSLSSVTAATLKAEGIKTVFVVGGPLAITTTVVKAIEALTAYGCGGKTPSGKITVTRIAGTTQYGTAMAIAEHVGTAASKAFAGAYATTNAAGGTGKFNDTAGKGSAAPTGSVPTAILASGVEFQDAQAASVISYRTKLPLLLTPPSTLSTTTVAAIGKLGIKQVILMGGTLAVTTTVEAALIAKTGVSVLRVAGKDYTDTAVQLARFEAAAATTGLAWTPGHKALVARGNGFTDGIAGAVLDSPHNTATGAAGTARPLLLTETPTVVGTFLTAFLKTTGNKGIDGTAAKTITSFTVLGGPLALTTATVAQMQTDLAH